MSRVSLFFWKMFKLWSDFVKNSISPLQGRISLDFQPYMSGSLLAIITNKTYNFIYHRITIKITLVVPVMLYQWSYHTVVVKYYVGTVLQYYSNLWVNSFRVEQLVITAQIKIYVINSEFDFCHVASIHHSAHILLQTSYIYEYVILLNVIIKPLLILEITSIYLNHIQYKSEWYLLRYVFQVFSIFTEKIKLPLFLYIMFVI